MQFSILEDEEEGCENEFEEVRVLEEVVDVIFPPKEHMKTNDFLEPLLEKDYALPKHPFYIAPDDQQPDSIAQQSIGYEKIFEEHLLTEDDGTRDVMVLDFDEDDKTPNIAAAFLRKVEEAGRELLSPVWNSYRVGS